MDDDLKEVCEATIGIKAYIEKRKKSVLNNHLFKCLCDLIAYALNKWTGSTYVGNEKTEFETNIYQLFFFELCNLIIFLKNDSIVATHNEKEFIESLVSIYRLCLSIFGIRYPY